MAYFIFFKNQSLFSAIPTPFVHIKYITALSNYWEKTIEEVTLFTYEYLQSLYLYESVLGITSCIFLVSAAVTHKQNKKKALDFAATSSQLNAYRLKLTQLTDDSVVYFAQKLSIFFIVLGGIPYFCLFLYACGYSSFCYNTILFLVSVAIKFIQAPYCIFFCSFTSWDTFWFSWELLQLTTFTNFLAYTPYGPELLLRDTYASQPLGLFEYLAFPHTLTSQLFFLTEFSTWYHIFSFLFLGFYLFIVFKGFNATKIFCAGYSYEFLFFLLLSVLGLNLFINSTNFFSMYVTMEFFSLCLYLLIFSARYLTISIEAGIKYLFLGAFNTTFLLLGVALIYFNLRTTSILDVYYHLAWLYYIPKLPVFGILSGNDLSDYIVTEFTSFGFLEDPILSDISITLLAGITCIIFGFLFKLAVAPFHFWALDVYEGAPLAVTFFLAVFVKSTLFFYFLRLVFFVFFPLFGGFFRYLFLCVGLLSLVIGAFGGLAQKKVKRLFAYSSLTNVGFLFIILAAVEPNFLLLTMKSGGLFYVITYALGYFLTMIIVFAILLFFFETSEGLNLRYITDLQLLRYNYGKWGILLACCLFSLAGVPPFPGFFLKFYGLVNVGSSIFHYVLLGTALLTTVSTFYYMRLIKIMYFDELNTEHLQSFDYTYLSEEKVLFNFKNFFSIETKIDLLSMFNYYKSYITFERILYTLLVLFFSIFTYSILLMGYWWSHFTYFCVDSFTVPFGILEARTIESFGFSTCLLTENYITTTQTAVAQHLYFIDPNNTIFAATTEFLPLTVWSEEKTYLTLLILRAMSDLTLHQEFQIASTPLMDMQVLQQHLGRPVICLVSTNIANDLSIKSSYFFSAVDNLSLLATSIPFESINICSDIKNPIIGEFEIALASLLFSPIRKNNLEYRFIFYGLKGNIFPIYFLKLLIHLHKFCQQRKYIYFTSKPIIKKAKLAYFSHFVKSIPTRSALISVLRSPHVFKTAQEQFKLVFQKQIIFFNLFSCSFNKTTCIKHCILNLLRDLPLHFRMPLPFFVTKCVEQKLVILNF